MQNSIDLFTQIENAAHEGAFGHNLRPTPTDAQCQAGNYKVGRVQAFGLNLAIEQPRHSYRTGIDPKTGKRWSTRLAAHYGYIQGTKGNDGDPVDCFIGAFPQSERAYVVNQYVNGQWDEHKILLGFPDESSARQAYLDSYERGWQGLHSLVQCSISQLKWWLKNGNLKKPLKPDYLPYEGIETMNLNRITWDSAAQPERMTLDQLLYEIRRADGGNTLLLDSVTMADILEEADEILTFDALTSPFARLERKMQIMKSVMERAGGEINPVSLQVSEPFKQNGVAQVAAVFELSDGQTVTVYFHNPDVNPKKIAPADELISWKWLLNKKDVTIVVAPERGEDLNVREVANRIMKLAAKNSAAFQRANAKRAEKMQVIQGLKDEIVVLEKELTDAQHELEVAKVEAEDRAAKQQSIVERILAGEAVVVGDDWIDNNELPEGSVTIPNPNQIATKDKYLAGLITNPIISEYRSKQGIDDAINSAEENGQGGVKLSPGSKIFYLQAAQHIFEAYLGSYENSTLVYGVSDSGELIDYVSAKGSASITKAKKKINEKADKEGIDDFSIHTLNSERLTNGDAEDFLKLMGVEVTHDDPHVTPDWLVKGNQYFVAIKNSNGTVDDPIRYYEGAEYRKLELVYGKGTKDIKPEFQTYFSHEKSSTSISIKVDELEAWKSKKWILTMEEGTALKTETTEP